ncbi:malic enzyme [Bradyrhizobium diazoefficiens]
MDQDLKEAALEYHRLPTPGKISVVPTKAMATQRDLALAYSPARGGALPGHCRGSVASRCADGAQ